MGVLDEYNALKKKRKEKKSVSSILDEYNAIKAQRENVTDTDRENSRQQLTAALLTGGDIAPVLKKTAAGNPLVLKESVADMMQNNDIAPVSEERKWFEKGAFEDGYQRGDVIKTILGTDKDILDNMGSGAKKMLENAVDAGATAVGFVADKFGADGFANKVKDFVGKDLSSESPELFFKPFYQAMLTNSTTRPIAGAIKGISALNKILNGEDDNSVLGDRADGLVQTGTRYAIQSGLQAAGVPWQVTAGVTSFGGEAENAFREGANYNEATLSGLISSGGEILGEYLTGGAFGAPGLDDVAMKGFTRDIANKTLRSALTYVTKSGGESLEEVFSWAISRLGQKLTYADEKTWKELYASDEAKEELVDSVVGSFLISGTVQGADAVQSKKAGVDYTSKLTANEEAVVKRIYEDKVAEAEKDGKVTRKQKDAIYDKVIRDMERGYISTDTIEEVLGGETYKTHKDTIDSEKAMQEEYDTLYQMKNGDKSDAQIDRQAELKQKLDDIKQNFNRNQLQDEVMSLVRNDRLAESYNERSRRGQAFEADISKYDEKQRVTIQKAIDSGILNNTNRTHEFVDMIAKITADKGVPFDFTNNERLKESGFALNGKTVNGYVTKDGVTLNIDSAKSLNSVVGHEITHVLEGTEMYPALQSVVAEYAKTKGEYQSRYDSLAKLYEDIEGADIDAELTADLVGDYLFTDPDFVKHLSVTNRKAFQKLFDEIKYLCKIATAGSKELRELEKVKKLFEEAYRAEIKNTADNSDVKYSITEPFTDANGNQFENAVLLDTDFFDGVSPRNWGQKLRDAVGKRAVNNPFILPIVDESGNTVMLQFANPKDRVTKNGASNHKVLDELSTTSDNISKLAVIHVDEIVSVSEENSPYYTNENKHQWLDQNGWLHRNTNVINQRNGNIYNLTVDIAKTADGRTILYATNGKIKRVGNVKVDSLKIKGPWQNSNSGDRVAQNDLTVKMDYSLSDSNVEDIAPIGNYNVYGKDIALEAAPVREGIAGNEAPVADTKTGEPGKTVQNTRKELSTKINNLQTELGNNQRLREQSNADFEEEIAQLQAEYNGLTNKNTKKANDLLRRIERRQRMKNNVDADYANRIANLEQRIEKMSSDTYQTAAQRKVKQQGYAEQMEALVGDTATWRDKKLGVFYKVNTLRRNLRDVVRKADGSRDIEKADAIYDELQGKYNHNEAILNREASQIKQPYADMKITKAEDAYIQMLGELRHNPDTTLTEDVVNEFYEKHKGNIDKAKVDKAIEMARKTYDELLIRVNEVLREQGMKEIPYRKGYFPHFTEDRQSFLAKLFNWKTHNNDIPTDIAGLTENFNPNRSWQSFNKERKSDTTDYSFMKGMDTYVQGALDWVHHIEDIQKRRAFENYLRYIHSEQGVKDKIEAIKKNEEYDADEMQKQIDLVYEEARNPLNNFVVDLRAGTNTLANKKSSMDRGLEDATNRKFYSTMTNISSRVSANMVGGSISSALTNFIPITQSWGQVSPVSSLRAMGDTIRSTFRDDGTINKSDFLTNRLRPADKLYKSGWDKVSNAAGLLMEGIDSFTSQTVWRSKYLENISNGMSESEAIKNADQFAENVLAGRSRGNQPTIFDSKNPLVKTLTAFQLEVANQYGYMLKDMPQDMRNETKAKLVKGYATMFLGAYAYNALFSSLTGRDAAFDPIGIIEDLLRDLGLFGDDEEEEEIAPVDVGMNLTENILQEVPFVGGLMGGGRVPISSALPYDGNVMDIMEGAGKLFLEGDTSDLTSEWLKPVYYVASPVGGGQIKKTVEGLSMFSNDHPIAGSYTKSGDLRFPVDDTIGSRVKAGLFGQWSSKNARHYFDNDIAPLDEKRVQEYTDLGLSYEEYWAYRDDMSAISKRAEEDGASKEDVVKSKYIDSVNSELSAIQAEKDKVMEDTKLSAKEKEARIGELDKQFADLAKERHRSYNDVSFDGDFANIGSHYYQWYTPEKGEAYWRKLDEAQVAKYQAIRNVGANAHYATNGTTHYRLEEGGNPKNFSDWTKISDKDLARQREVTRELGITPEEYWSKTETSFIPMKSGEYEYAYENPGNYGVAKVVGGYEDYTGFMDAIGEFDSKNANGETVSGLKKERVTAYINGLDLEYGQKIILYRSQYDSKADRAAYDADIFEYLNGRDDISYEEKVAIFKKLGFSVSADGYVTW